MPELPDILLYIHALRPRIVGHAVTGVRLASPFLLRSVDPPRDDLRVVVKDEVFCAGERLETA